MNDNPENIGYIPTPPDKDHKRIGVIAHVDAGRSIIPDIVYELAKKSIGQEVIVVGKGNGADSYKIDKDGNIELFDIKTISSENLPPPPKDLITKISPNFNDISLSQLIKDNIPNKLQMLKQMNLSPKQIDYFKNAPAYRLEGESDEDYKTRRMLNKLLIKYRGQY